jgi:uncharacterized membrane protein YebE (DUF533 family)
MKDAKSLLDGLLGGRGGLGGLASSAKGAWDGQSGLAKGAMAGGLLGILMGGSGTRRMAKSALKVGGAALIGGLAYKAYEDWQAGKAATTQPTDPAALPAPEGTAFLPADPIAADDLSARLLRAMVAAAKADGHVTPTERRRIGGQLATLGLGDEAQNLIEAELDSPLDVGAIAGLAKSQEEAAEIYAASLLVVDPDAPAEKGYLAMLAARLQLPPGLVEHLHARAASLV